MSSIIPATLDQTYIKNSSFNLRLTIKDELNNLRNTTGWKGLIEVSGTLDTDATLLSVGSDVAGVFTFGETTIGDKTYNCIIKMAPDMPQLKALVKGEHAWSLTFKDTSNNEDVYFQGTLNVMQTAHKTHITF